MKCTMLNCNKNAVVVWFGSSFCRKHWKIAEEKYFGKKAFQDVVDSIERVRK